jgi:alpha-ketoglutarate-dependent taurine dioxygenase
MNEALLSRGFAVVDDLPDYESYRAFAKIMGELIAEERIALRPGAHAYVAKPGRVPLHTDHPEVNIIGWYCEEQDDTDGASLLLDARPVIDRLNSQARMLLRTVRLACPPLQGGPPTLSWPVLRERERLDALFCSPWLRSVEMIVEHQVALQMLQEELSKEAQTNLVDVRLQPGRALFVDNTRILHGRRPISDSSRRVLRRIWLRTQDAG